METFEVKGPDGSTYEVRAPSAQAAIAAMRKMGGDYVQPEPPPGAIIHGAEGSTVAGQNIGVDTRNMTLEQRDAASRALAARSGGTGMGRAMPFFQGLSFSGGDEIVSGAYGALGALRGRDFGDEYNYAQEVQRQELEQARTDRPIESALTQVAGNVAGFIPLSRAAGALGVAPSMAGRSMFGKTVIGGGVGGSIGATDGFLSGSGGADRAKKAGIGAAVGTTAGATVPLFISGAKSGIQRIADSATVDKMLKGIGIGRPAADQIKRALDADAGSAARNIRTAGPDAMLADSGPASRGMLDTAVQTSGQAGNRTIDAVNRRVSNSLRSVTQKLDTVLGSPRGIREAARGIRQGSAGARSGAYDAAYDSPIDYASNAGRQLESMFTRIPREAIREANALMQLKGERSPQILMDVLPDGTINFRQMPDVRQLDYITRGLNQAAKNLDGTGALAGQTPRGSALLDLSNEIRTVLRNTIPAYDDALKTAREPIQQIEGMRFGYDMLKPSTPRDVVSMGAERMTPPQLDAARMGLRSYIDDTLANVRTAASNIDKDGLPELRKILGDLSTKAARDKMRVIIPNRREYAELVRELDRASRSLLLSADTSVNTRTFGRQATQKGVQDSMAPGVVGNAARGNPLATGKSAVQNFFGTTPQDDIARTDEVWSQIAKFLTSPQGSVPTQRANQALMDAYRVGTRNEALAGNVAQPLGLSIGSGAYQGGQKLLDR